MTSLQAYDEVTKTCEPNKCALPRDLYLGTLPKTSSRSPISRLLLGLLHCWDTHTGDRDFIHTHCMIMYLLLTWSNATFQFSFRLPLLYRTLQSREPQAYVLIESLSIQVAKILASPPFSERKNGKGGFGAL